MKEGRDLAVTLFTAAILLVGVGYLTQCSTTARRPSPQIESTSEKTGAEPDADHEASEGEENEEHEKIQRVGRALQTIGANPEMRKTYGVPQ